MEAPAVPVDQGVAIAFPLQLAAGFAQGAVGEIAALGAAEQQGGLGRELRIVWGLGRCGAGDGRAWFGRAGRGVQRLPGRRRRQRRGRRAQSYPAPHRQPLRHQGGIGGLQLAHAQVMALRQPLEAVARADHRHGAGGRQEQALPHRELAGIAQAIGFDQGAEADALAPSDRFQGVAADDNNTAGGDAAGGGLRQARRWEQDRRQQGAGAQQQRQQLAGDVGATKHGRRRSTGAGPHLTGPGPLRRSGGES